MGIAPTQSSTLSAPHRISQNRISRTWSVRIVTGITFVCLLSTLSIRFYAEPRLRVGAFVDQDVRSPKTLQATDVEATKQAKELAKQQVVPSYRINPDIDNDVINHLEDLLRVGDNLRIAAGGLPYVDRQILIDDTQRYLRQISDLEWEQMQDRAIKLAFSVNNRASDIPMFLNRDKSIFSTALAELTLYKVTANSQDYQKLIVRVTEVRKAYAIAQQQTTKSPEMFRDRLLEMSNEEWGITKKLTWQALLDLQASGVVAGLPSYMLQKRLSNLSNLPINPEHRLMAIALLTATVKPNMNIDYVGTAERAIKASESVETQRIFIEVGDIIVKGGEKITEHQFVILDELKMTQRQVNFNGLFLIGLSTAIAFAVFGYANQRWQYLLKVKLHVKDLWVLGIVCIGTTLTTVLMAPNTLLLLPLASMGLIIGSFYSSRLALLITGLTTGLLAIAISSDLLTLTPIIIGAMVAAAITDRPLTRSHIAAAGLAIGLLQASVYIAIAIIGGATPMVLIVMTALQYASGGLIASIVALGAIPYLEHIAYALTPFRLAELANLDRPLLRLLVTETPGTFQHTLFVANLAEAAARKLGADTSLVRTGTLYHDIGKTIRPEYFIENQMGQLNPHDTINDPWESAKIIKEHVSGGLKIAQKYHLPEMLQAFIPEHQGTITITYFYCQAQKRADCVIESEFRYAGPIPQSRETGIVMLADACEAALRSLGNETTLEAANELLMRIFQARWDDGQMRDSSLTWDELIQIAPVFIKIWQERNHGRIKYPQLASKLDPSGSALPGHTCDTAEVQPQAQIAIKSK
jgi:putative nucleotidyltransferase with HDIG domain